MLASRFFVYEDSFGGGGTEQLYVMALVGFEVKRFDRKGGRVVRVLKSETERVVVLKEVFGITAKSDRVEKTPVSLLKSKL